MTKKEAEPKKPADADEPPAIEDFPPANKRTHRATFSADKMRGGFRIRVSGPHANRFAGRYVPVTRKNGTETVEKLTTVQHSGTDEETGVPYALYGFERKTISDVAF